jgi:threonylcarbamoyladenosine tRNA methylthiotransferase MtaB
MDRKGPLRIAFTTLGCKVNQSDAASLASQLAGQGYQTVSFREPADVCIIHTCTVTQKTDYQSRQLIRRAISRNPQGKIIVTGCYAQVSPESLKAIPGVDFVVGVEERQKIPALISTGETEEKPQSQGNGKGSLSSDRTRVYLKVQDGCNSFCSYCIVPYSRGRNRSLPLEKVLADARGLSRLGYKEIVLTGIHLGAYGEDLGIPHGLRELLQALEQEMGGVRIRLSSIEPREFTPDLIDFLGRSRTICPHLHLPLQSGDDGILKMMNRNYSGSFFKNLVNRLVQTIPDLAIGLDVILGFPGEDETAFQNTFNLIEGLPIAYLHVFPFSRRKGTPAESFPGQVPSQAIKARCQTLRELGGRKREAFFRSFLGRTVRVLVENKKDRESGFFKGYSPQYIPVLLPAAEEWVNREVEVKVIEVRGEKVCGRIL